MDPSMLASVLALSSLSPFIVPHQHGLSKKTSTTLIKECFDRAVLLLELTDYVLEYHLNVAEVELNVIHVIQTEIALALPGETLVKGRHIPVAVPRIATQNVVQAAHSLMPPSWDFLDARAAGILLDTKHLMQVIGDVYEEHVRLERHDRRLQTSYGVSWLFTIKDRCVASGLSEFVPTVVLGQESTSNTSSRQQRGRPQARMKSKQTTLTASHPLAWRFSGHLASIIKIRAQLANMTVKSSGTVKSEWKAWGLFMDSFFKNHPHFPVLTEHLAPFLGFFDNADSAKKYLSAIRKASLIQETPFPTEEEVKSIVAGVTKGAVKAEKSFITGDKVSVVTESLIMVHKRTDLACFVMVAYTFQLRVQSEGIKLTISKRGLLPEDTWHSHVYVDDDSSVVIRLRSRKNTPLPSIVRRYCICVVWGSSAVCGVCVLKEFIIKHPPDFQGRIFPLVKENDIKLLKRIGAQKDLGHITWHGLRRGRTDDVVNSKDSSRNPSASIQDIADSLGHHLGRASFFSYIKTSSSHRRLVKGMAEDTESE